MLEFVGRILSIEPLIIEYPAGYKWELEKLAQKDSLIVKIAPPRKLRSTGEYSQNHHLNDISSRYALRPVMILLLSKLS